MRDATTLGQLASLDEYRNDIMAALKTRKGQIFDIRDEQAAWTEIQAAILTIRRDHDRREQASHRDKTGAARLDFYDKLSKDFTAASAGLRKLRDDAEFQAPMAWAVAEPDLSNGDLDEAYINWEWVEKEISKATDILDGLTGWIAKARDEAGKAVLQHRPPTPLATTLDRLAYVLGGIFYFQTARFPTFSNGEECTPFERFMSRVVKAMQLNATRTQLKGAVRRLTANVLKVAKNRHEFLLDANQPAPDGRKAADVFAEFMKTIVS